MTWRHGLLLLVIPCTVSLPGCSGGGAPLGGAPESSDIVEVQVVPVQRFQINSSLELVGTLFPWKSATIASEVAGTIKRIPESGEQIEYEVRGRKYSRPVILDIGHRVRKGDILVEIDSTEYDLALKAAEAKLALAEKELEHLTAWKRPEEVDQLQAQFDEATALLEQAQADLERSETLLARKAATQDKYEDSLAAFRTARAARKRAEAALKLAKAGPSKEQTAVAEARVEMAKAQVVSQADKVSKCTIRCPLETAIITERYVGVGDRATATPRTEIMQIIDPRILLAEVGVPERFQRRIRLKQKATVRAEGVTSHDSADDGVPAMVVLINEKIDPETRTFRVRIGIDNSAGLFKPGTFVRVSLPIDSAPNALVVPRRALSIANGQPAVFLYQGGHVEKRPVTLGISDPTHYEICSGVAEGDQVVAGNTSLLADGLAVRVKDAGSSAALPSEVK